MRAAKDSYNATVSESRQKGTNEVLHDFLAEIDGVEVKPVEVQSATKRYATIELVKCHLSRQRLKMRLSKNSS
jgi:hypothetical protein